MLLQKHVYFAHKILTRKNLLEKLYTDNSVTATDKSTAASCKLCAMNRNGQQGRR